MKFRLFIQHSVWALILLAGLLFPAITGAQTPGPVTPDASPEARALLRFLQELSGEYILSGQHNFPASGDRNTRFAKVYTGKTPVIWSQDFGFAERGDKDSYLARPAIIQEAIRKHRQGAIVTLCWHAVPPTADEPVTFQPLPGSENTPLASVQGRLTEEQFRDILTPGTDLYNHWTKQVDEIATYLKQLREAKVPVLWRPYHEMNGDWFWWGGHEKGKFTSAALYRQLFDRFVNVHKLNNLIWVWSVDRPTNPSREFNKYYPGDQYLDILSLDIYGNDFNPVYYEKLTALSKGKPVALGEVGNPPSPEIIQEQPNWIYWVIWAGMVRNTLYNEYEKLIADPHVLYLEKPAFLEAIKPYREACGLEPLVIDLSADFTGSWKLNECESSFGRGDFARTPYQLNITRKENTLHILLFSVVEWEGDKVVRQTLTLDGTENPAVDAQNHQEVKRATWSPRKDTLNIRSVIKLNVNGRESEMVSEEFWTLHRGGRKLVILRTTRSSNRTRTSKLVYDKL